MAPKGEAADESRMNWPLLLLGIGQMLLFTADPRLLSDAQGKADHLAATLAGAAMAACIVRGVGFVPRQRGIRVLLSGAAAALYTGLLAGRLLL